MQQKGDGKVLALSAVAIAAVLIGGMLWWAITHPTEGKVKGAETQVRIKGVAAQNNEINSMNK